MPLPLEVTKGRHRWQWMRWFHPLRTAVGELMGPAQSWLRALVRAVAEVAAQPVPWLWKNRIALENAATTMTGNDNDKNSTEVPKFRFWPDNRGANLSKQAKIRTGDGESGTSELCPRRRGKFQSSPHYSELLI
jgi:hypothetical protein